MDLSDFDFHLPDELIAQEAEPTRDAARLMSLDRKTGETEHHRVSDLADLLKPGDLIVVNDSRVIQARLLGRRDPSGGKAECLLLSRLDETRWDALVHPGQKLRQGARAVFEAGEHYLELEVLDCHFHGRRTIRLVSSGDDIETAIDAIGHTPLPPYIKREDRSADRERYQTVFARTPGSVAAPTAGLHFTAELLARLSARGISRQAITLHVGYGTFEPVRTAKVEDHRVAAEHYYVSEETADAVNCALDEGRRIIAVGTTTTRTLEAVARLNGGRLRPGEGQTDLYIHGSFDFKIVGGLLTNFHLPRSSLLLLVAAFTGHERILSAYGQAIARSYRFYSYGDAMLIL